MDGGMIERLNGSGWLGINSWLWSLTLVTIVFAVSLSWSLNKKNLVMIIFIITIISENKHER